MKNIPDETVAEVSILPKSYKGPKLLSRDVPNELLLSDENINAAAQHAKYVGTVKKYQAGLLLTASRVEAKHAQSNNIMAILAESNELVGEPLRALTDWKLDVLMRVSKEGNMEILYDLIEKARSARYWPLVEVLNNMQNTIVVAQLLKMKGAVGAKDQITLATPAMMEGVGSPTLRFRHAGAYYCAKIAGILDRNFLPDREVAFWEDEPNFASQVVEYANLHVRNLAIDNHLIDASSVFPQFSIDELMHIFGVKYSNLVRPQDRLLQSTGKEAKNDVELLDKLQEVVAGAFGQDQGTSDHLKLGIKTAKTLLGVALDLRSMKAFHQNTVTGDGYKPAIILVPVTKGVDPRASRDTILTVRDVLYY